MEESYRLLNLTDFVKSVMLQLKPFLVDGSSVHFKVPTTCEVAVSEDLPIEYYSRVYNSNSPEADKPSYIEFDIINSQIKKEDCISD